MIVNIFTDGGARGNPGPAGYGVVVKTFDNKIIYQKSSYLGIKTNNEAEYAGLISALQWLKDNYQNLDINQVTINSDSQLLICQIQGLYKVKAENLKLLFAQSRDLLENSFLLFLSIFLERKILGRSTCQPGHGFSFMNRKYLNLILFNYSCFYTFFFSFSN